RATPAGLISGFSRRSARAQRRTDSAISCRSRSCSVVRSRAARATGSGRPSSTPPAPRECIGIKGYFLHLRRPGEDRLWGEEDTHHGAKAGGQSVEDGEDGAADGGGERRGSAPRRAGQRRSFEDRAVFGDVQGGRDGRGLEEPASAERDAGGP